VKHFINIDAVKIPSNRQRSSHGIAAHQDLVESIRNRGLLHAPVLRFDGSDYVLVAGERRLRAMRDLIELGERFSYNGELVPSGLIPHTDLGDLTPLEAEEAELEENVRRVDLTWQDKAAATARLADLRARQAEAAGRPAPSVAEIALEVRGRSDGDYHGNTSREIILARHLDDPEVAKATTLKDAYKILQRKDRAERNEILATAVGKSLTGNSHDVRHGDCLELLRGVPGGSVDCILSDPPYGIEADEFGDSGGLADGAHFYKDDYASWQVLMDKFIPETYRVTKADAHLYLFCDIDRFHELRFFVERAGWTPFRTPLIWSKPEQSARAPWPDAGPQRKYECILFAKKGAKKVQHLRSDILEFPKDDNLGHPAQKPVALYEELLYRSVMPGDRVLDPFAGTGPIIPAGHNLKCFVMAFERNPAAYGICASRTKLLGRSIV
jgi:site-specific DNA-methyltransferase (adenine-specific)